VATAARLAELVRDSDTAARLGGDEFALLVSNVEDAAAVEAVAERVVGAFAEPFALATGLITSTVTVGVATTLDSDYTDELLRHADLALYAAKAAGKRQWRRYQPVLSAGLVRRRELQEALEEAVAKCAFTLVYQPIVALDSGELAGFEALVRWPHAQWGMMQPDQFIALAEETGQIIALGEWALNTACSEAARIQHRTGQPLILAVNVSPRQFQQADWLDVVQAALRHSGLAPQHLELEITEGLLMRNPEESAAVLGRLRAMGVTVVIDDFGTGYSSLSYLTRFPIDKIKIDRSFVRDLSTDAADAAVINAIIAMAHSLNIRVIAEGVESQAQQAYLSERGCDEAQGYYYGAAVPIERFMALAA
jgi:EAL domain-containing protein (putative c-di-GMP-specific phosphodiesterase class I)